MAEIPGNVKHQHEEARFEYGRCVFADGTPASVPMGKRISCTPPNYTKFYEANPGTAQDAWKKTQQWRMQEGVWEILCNPSPLTARMRETSPVVIHGVSKTGLPVLYELTNKMDFVAMFDGMKIKDHMSRYTHMIEFGMNEVCKGRGAAPGFPAQDFFRIIYIMDIASVDLVQLVRGKPFYCRKLCLDVIRAHYPLCFEYTLVLNPQRWAMSIVSAFMKKLLWGFDNATVLAPNGHLEKMREIIDDDQIPVEYGGSSPYKLGEHPYQIALNENTDTMAMMNQNRTGRSVVPCALEEELKDDVAPTPKPQAALNVRGDPSLFALCMQFIPASVAMVTTILFGVLCFLGTVHELVSPKSITTAITSHESYSGSPTGSLASTVASFETESVSSSNETEKLEPVLTPEKTKRRKIGSHLKKRLSRSMSMNPAIRSVKRFSNLRRIRRSQSDATDF